MAVSIVFNAKTERTGVCNACESLVVHRAVEEAFLNRLCERLKEKPVVMYGDEAARREAEPSHTACHGRRLGKRISGL